MAAVKGYILLCLVLFPLVIAFPNPKANHTTSVRNTRRIHIPALGIGPECTGCPENYCDDDSSIIHGYCCGCARFFDNLPVKCSTRIECPLNGHGLCEDYEYMMHCCC